MKIEKYLTEAKFEEEELKEGLEDILNILSVEQKNLWRSLNTLQHKDRYESEDYEDENFYKFAYLKVSNVLETLTTLRNVYEKRVLTLKKRYK